MTIIPRALVQHQLRCDVQDCHACGGDHVGLFFWKLVKPYGSYTWTSCCSKTAIPYSQPILMRESEAGPFGKDKDDEK